MDSPGRSRKRGMDEGSDGKNNKAMDDEEYEGHEKRKHKSSKSRKSSYGEDVDGDGRRKCSGDRNDNRKRVGGSSKGYRDGDDYDIKKESYPDKVKKKQEESTLEKLINCYRDRDLEMRYDGGDKSGGRPHSRLDESEKNISRKAASKYTDAESSQGRSKSRDERSYDDEHDRTTEKDPRNSYRRESSREKLHGSSEQGGKRLDDSDTVKNTEVSSYKDKTDPRSGKDLDPKHESSRERASSRLETSEGKNRALDSSSDKAKSYSKEERRGDAEKMKSRSRCDAVEDDYKGGSAVQEDISGRKRTDKYREIKATRNDALESREKSSNLEEDSTLAKDKSGREIGLCRRSKTPERSERHCHESHIFEMEHDTDRSGSNCMKEKDLDKEASREDKVKGRDDSWGDRNRDSDGSRENWKRKQPSGSDRDGDAAYNCEREWELPRRGRDRIENERPSGRPGNRKDGRGEVVKGSSNYDIIEIHRKPLDYGRDDRESSFARKNIVTQSHSKSAPNDARDDWHRPGAQGSASTGDALQEKYVHEGALSQDQGSWKDDADSQGARLRGQRVTASFGPLSIPTPGSMQQLIPPGMFIPPFSPPVWSGPRGLDMSILPVSSGVSSLAPGLPGQRFLPDMGTPPNPLMFFNLPGHGMTSNASGSTYNAVVPVGRGQSHDKTSGGWVPPKSSGPSGKAPSRGEQNDYSQNFVDTGMRPQNFIRELELTNVEDYPKLRELIQKKDEIVAKVASPPMYHKCDLREFVLSPEFFGTKFDVILVDPPWEEYVHRAPGVTEHMESWTFDEIMNLKIEAIADTPSFIFLWVGDGVGLEQGRQCLKKWGFRRCEDICWVKTNKHTASLALRHDSHTLFQHTKEHCLMGIKGTVRRSTDGHIIHANIDTDVIIAGEPPYGSTAKPDEIYRIIEHFALGRRRIELFGEDHNIRPGWLTVGKGLTSSNFDSEGYMRNFTDKDGKVWQGGGGRNPPPESPHLVVTTLEIESLRPKSPMKNQQQLQQQSDSIPLTSSSSNRKPAENSSQTPNPFGLNQEGPSSHLPPWALMEAMRGREISSSCPYDSLFDMYSYNIPPVLPNGEFIDFESQRTMNMM